MSIVVVKWVLWKRDGPCSSGMGLVEEGRVLW
jgi:hypothetical protein